MKTTGNSMKIAALVLAALAALAYYLVPQIWVYDPHSIEKVGIRPSQLTLLRSVLLPIIITTVIKSRDMLFGAQVQWRSTPRWLSYLLIAIGPLAAVAILFKSARAPMEDSEFITYVVVIGTLWAGSTAFVLDRIKDEPIPRQGEE